MKSELNTAPIDLRDRAWVASLLEQRWKSTRVVTRGVVHQADTLPGFIARLEELPQGLVTCNIVGTECEIVSLDSLVGSQGIGTALVEAVCEEAANRGCKRLWLITTNDNLPALRFYQKRGFHLAAIYPNALEESRRLKPEISHTGLDGIPLRDEIELEMLLGDDT